MSEEPREKKEKKGTISDIIEAPLEMAEAPLEMAEEVIEGVKKIIGPKKEKKE